MHYLNILLAFIAHHPRVAYGVISLISFSESLAIVGLLVPGTLIMFGTGAIVATGTLGLAPVLMLAAAGAIAGDGVSYWLGCYYQERLKGTWPFSRYPGMLQNGETFFRRHGGKSVLFGRFVGPVRPFIPVVAGMLGMNSVHFSIVNVLSAIGWALVYILPGVFFGTSLAMAGTVSTRLAVLVFILVACIWCLIWLSRKVVSFFENKVPTWFALLKEWAAPATNVRGGMLPIKHFFSFLFLHQQGEDFLLGFLVLTLFGAGWAFSGVLQDVLAKDPLVIADQAVYHFFQSLRIPWADRLFVVITELGDSFVNLFLSGAVLIVLLVKRCLRTAGFWVLAVFGGLLGVQLLKWTLHLPRPVAIYHGASSFGFPSGHTTMGVILYGFLAILLARGLSGVWRWRLFSSVVGFSFIIGISRLYLGAHWLSDVLGGFLFGTSWAALLGIASLKVSAEIVPRRLLGLVVILVMVIVGGWHVAQRHDKDLAFYALRQNVQTMPLASWQAESWHELAAWRIDLEGEAEQPLTIQWAGKADDLARFLIGKGWKQPPLLSLKCLFGVFSPDTPVGELPVFPHLHDGRAERLLLFYTDRTKRLVLRLWPADVLIAGNDTPLFVGTIEEQGCYELANLITMARDTGEYEPPVQIMEHTLADRFTVRRVRRTDHETRIDHEHRWLHWQGSVLTVWGKSGE
jgi:membrane protein DedA with SNARE-associated domain/membrane-associated phospholipid phosphatase